MDKLNAFNRADGKRLEGREYTNGTSQIQAIEDIKNAFNEGNKIVILKNGCGGGKSLVALETLREFGGGYVVVPRIMHQKQYTRDYSGDKSRIYLEDKEGKEVKIISLMGKHNFECVNNKGDVKRIPESKFCDWTGHVCNSNATSEIKLESCPFYMSNREVKLDSLKLDGVCKINDIDYIRFYQSVRGTRKLVFATDEKILCRYHKQFMNCIDNNIVIINARKLEIECAMGRLPQKPVLALDEFDSVLLDIVSPKQMDISRAIKNLKKIKESVDTEKGKTKEEKERDLKVKIILDKIQRILEQEEDRISGQGKDSRFIKSIYNGESFDIFDENKFKNSTLMIEQLKCIFEEKENNFLSDIKGVDTIYNFFVYNRIPEFNFFYDINKRDGLVLNYFNLNASKIINNIFSKFSYILLMSATKQSDYILKEFYGIDNYKIVKGEETIVGRLYNTTLGNEIIFNNNAKDKKLERIRQLEATGKTIEYTRTKGGVPLNRLCHVVNISKLPEPHEYNINDGLRELGTHNKDNEEESFNKFIDPTNDVHFHKSTVMRRAIDLPGEMCRVVIFQKLPYTFPFSAYYKAIERRYSPEMKKQLLDDECERELIQGANRGIRSKDDWCIVCSPDIKVYNWIKKIKINTNNQRIELSNYTDGKIW